MADVVCEKTPNETLASNSSPNPHHTALLLIKGLAGVRERRDTGSVSRVTRRRDIAPELEYSRSCEKPIARLMMCEMMCFDAHTAFCDHLSCHSLKHRVSNDLHPIESCRCVVAMG